MRMLAAGTYEIRVGVGRDESGRVVRRSRTVRGGIREARRVRAEMLLSAGGTPQPSSATVAELGKRWLADLERRGKSPNTVHGYRSKWKHIDRYMGDKKVARVTTTDRTRPASPRLQAWVKGRSGRRPDIPGGLSQPAGRLRT